MRTTLNIDAALLKKVMAITGEKNKGRAVDRAMEEFIRQEAIERLLSMRGKFKLRSREEWHEKDLELELEHLKERQW